MIEDEPSWAYVGRFMYAFGVLEKLVDEVVVCLLDLNAHQTLILLRHMDISLKLRLLKIAFKRRGDKSSVKRVNRVSDLSVLRNTFAHSSFISEKDPERGIVITFDYLPRGKMDVPDVFHSLADFDAWDAEMRDLWNEFSAMAGRCSAARRGRE